MKRNKILAATTRQEKPEVAKVLSERAILNLQKLVGSVAVSEHIIKYVASLVRATRPKDVSAPKFVQELGRLGRGAAGWAVSDQRREGAGGDGRAVQRGDRDVQKVAVPVLRHRISTNFQAQAEGMTTEDVDCAAAQRDSDAGDSEVLRAERIRFTTETRRHREDGTDRMRIANRSYSFNCNCISRFFLLRALRVLRG